MIVRNDCSTCVEHTHLCSTRGRVNFISGLNRQRCRVEGDNNLEVWNDRANRGDPARLSRGKNFREKFKFRDVGQGEPWLEAYRLT